MNCRNASDFIEESIQSVKNQTYTNWLLYIWDNASHDHTPKIVEKHRSDKIQYFRSNKSFNLGVARSKAFQVIKGDILCILDSDDIWMPDKLEKQNMAFQDKSVGISSSNIYYQYNNGIKKLRFANSQPSGNVTKKLLLSYYVSSPTIAIRMTVLNNLRPVFNRNYDHIADFDLVIRASKECKLNFINEPLAIYRVHHQSESFLQPQAAFVEFAIWCKKNLFSNHWTLHEKIYIGALLLKVKLLLAKCK